MRRNSTHAIWGRGREDGEARARAGRENSTHAIWGTRCGSYAGGKLSLNSLNSLNSLPKKREFREFKEFRENIPAIKNDNRKGLNAPCGCALAQYLIAAYSVKLYGSIASAYSLQPSAALYASTEAVGTYIFLPEALPLKALHFGSILIAIGGVVE